MPNASLTVTSAARIAPQKVKCSSRRTTFGSIAVGHAAWHRCHRYLQDVSNHLILRGEKSIGNVIELPLCHGPLHACLPPQVLFSHVPLVKLEHSAGESGALPAPLAGCGRGTVLRVRVLSEERSIAVSATAAFPEWSAAFVQKLADGAFEPLTTDCAVGSALPRSGDPPGQNAKEGRHGFRVCSPALRAPLLHNHVRQ